MTIRTPRLMLAPWNPAHILTLIEAPDAFGAAMGTSAADGLRPMFVSGEASTEWLDSLRSFTEPGELVDPEVGPVWRWELAR